MKLTLGKGMFVIIDKSLFQKEIQNASRGYFTLVQNSSKSEMLRGIYKPRLTLTKRFNYTGRFEQTLSIELSLSKLLFHNNFDELTDEDFPTIIELLANTLKTMGVLVFSAILESAPVSAVHYSKNIPLTDGTTPYFYIKKISEGNYKLSQDTDKANYRNDGQLFKLHVNSWELAFYDKINELIIAKKSGKRSIEKDSEIQLNLFEDLVTRKPFEILRMEARLNTRTVIRRILQAIGRDIEPTFRNLYNSQIAQEVLLHFLGEVENARPKLLDYKAEAMSVLPDIVVNNPKFSPRKQIMFYGLKHAMDTYGARELRKMLGMQKNREWYRLVKDSNEINLPKKRDVFSTIRTQLTEFEPLKLVDYDTRMLNNDKYN